MPFKTKEERNAYLAKWREANRERLREYHLSWSRVHGKRPWDTWRIEVFGTPEERRERRKAFYRDYNKRAHRREYVKRWEAANPDKVKAKLQKWQRSPQGKTRTKLEQERRQNAKGFYTPEQWTARVTYYGDQCWRCKGPWDAVDHVISIRRGGTNWPSNLRPICTPCNS